jgi:hypothetical protein
VVGTTVDSSHRKNAPPREPGDTFLLFSQFPGQLLLEDLPLAVGPDVYVETTPVDVLENADPPAFADFVLPGYHVDWTLWSNRCLRCPRAGNRASKREPGVLLFNSLAALRLWDPARICIEGKFELGKNEAMENAVLFHLKCPSPFDASSFYSPADVASAAAIAQRQLELWELGYQRVVTATTLFLHVTCGFSVSFQMSYLGLCSALEALFVPQGAKKATTLANRAARFLTLPETVGDWLEGEYGCGRNRLAHGDDDAVPWGKLREERRLAFGALHEIARLCILGFASLENGELAALSVKSAKRVQGRLDALAPAAGRFMDGQGPWKETLISEVERWLEDPNHVGRTVCTS